MKTDQTKFASLGLFNSFLLAAVIFLPLLVGSAHLQSSNEKLLQKAEAKEKAAVKFELNHFFDQLEPARFIEKAMSDMEKKLALICPVRTASNVDPGLYDAKTIERMTGFLEQNYQLKPVYLGISSYAGREFHSFFSNDFDEVKSESKKSLENLICSTLIFKIIKSAVYKNEEIRNRLQTINIFGQKFFGIDREVSSGILSRFFAPAINYSDNVGICEEVFTTRFSSNKIFVYYNGSTNGYDFHGGYFIVFAARDLPINTIFRQALFSRGKIERGIVASNQNLNELFRDTPFAIEYFRELPASYRTFDQTKAGKSCRDARLFIKVSSLKKEFLASFEGKNRLISVLRKVLLGLIFSFLVHTSLFGLKLGGKLRSKFLLIVGLVVFLPYAITGYLAGITLEQIDQMRISESVSAAESRLYEVSRFVDDFSLRRQLVAFEAKKNIANRFFARKAKVPKGPGQDDIIPETFGYELALFDKTGEIRVFHRQMEKVRNPYQLIRFMGYSYLDNLGILKSKNPRVRRELELAGLASGFLSSLRRDNIEGQLLRHEGVEVKNLAKLEQMSRMIFFIFPAAPMIDAPVEALSFTVFTDLDVFGQVFNQLGTSYNGFIRGISETAKFSFGIGRRSSDNMLEKFWPPKFDTNNHIKRLLEFAVMRGQSGRQVKELNEGIQVDTWRFDPDSQYVVAGTVESEPDRTLNLVFFLLPFAGGLFSFISLLFLADFLWEMFARPVKEFIPALDNIKNGNFKTRVSIDSRDELEILGRSFNSMTEGLQQREKMRRFLPQKLFEDVIENVTDEKRQLEKLTLSLLASDIRGFTSLNEKFPPEQIVAGLNEYFTVMELAVSENGGQIERFIGDAVIAVFYPDKEKKSAEKAVLAAMAMRRNLSILNEQRHARGDFLIENGIGIVTNQAWVATTGVSSGRRVHMVFGEIVKKANQLEALTVKLSGSRIAVCSATVDYLDESGFVKIDEDIDAWQPVFQGENDEH